MSSRALFASVLLLACCQRDLPPASGHAPQRVEAALQAAAARIDGAYLREQVARLSADELEGRGPATAGDRRTRAYLIEQLEALGLERPEDGWEQPLELVSVTTTMPRQWTFEHAGDALSLRVSDDFIAATGEHKASGELADAELVFVGYGIEAPEYGWDDFKGQDVRGKVLLMLNSDPDWDPGLFAGNTRLYYGRWTYKFESAARHGAAAALVIHTTASAGYPFQVVQTSWGAARFDLPSQGEPSLGLKGWLSEDAARRLVAHSGQELDALIARARSRDFTPVALGTTTSVRYDNQLARVATANVHGVIRGSDSQRRDEYVVIDAHHDHLGIGKPDARGDTIYNGALDNGAGVAQVLAIARALTALPRAPRRSVAVLFVAAEEQGLLGSRYFATHLPFQKVVANINYDGGSIWGRTRDITQVGRGKSSLDLVADRIAALQGRSVESDPFPDRGSFYRSDQLSFAQIGVPALYMKAGTRVLGKPEGWGRAQILQYEAQRYHQPSDELTADWNFDGMVEDARFGFRAAFEIADAEAKPSWNPGDEFAR
jgi:Zn-dependent M28 family amino/carboxypeptidase